MKRSRLILLIFALVLIVFAWWQVLAAPSGLIVRRFVRDGAPMVYLAPARAKSVPGILVAHGFAGSKQLMLGYGYTLAHAGYAVLLWDFGGHGANPAPLERDGLQRDLERAYAVLIEQPEVDTARLALLGHSMGSGAVMTAGIRAPDRYAATIAISPTGAEVSPVAPRNLLLQAGSLEGQFVRSAQGLLAKAGGASDDFAAGRARRFVIVPNAEHISILFRGESHRAVLDWLARAFGEPRDTAYTDRRIIWYGISLFGWLLTLVAVAPSLRPALPEPRAGRRWLSWIGLILAPLIACGVLAAANRALSLSDLGGLMVGGAVGLWLLVAGLVWLAFNLPARRPTAPDVAWGLGLFAVLSLAFGVMAQNVWLQWWLIAPRLLRWPLLALACLPWFLASGLAQRGASGGQRALWWLAQSVALVGGLILALALVPSLGFLLILLPLMPLLLGILAVAGNASGRAWAYALGGALFFGWVVAAVFPLAG